MLVFFCFFPIILQKTTEVDLGDVKQEVTGKLEEIFEQIKVKFDQLEMCVNISLAFCISLDLNDLLSLPTDFFVPLLQGEGNFKECCSSFQGRTHALHGTVRQSTKGDFLLTCMTSCTVCQLKN